MIRFLASLLAVMLLIATDRALAMKEIMLQKSIYRPFFRESGETDRPVGPILIDETQVTNAEFLDFVKRFPDWQKSRVQSLFTDPSYLAHWNGDTDFDRKMARQPVTNVSWFAARKYCESLGKRLLSIAEWEAASDAQAPENLEKILDWYAEPAGKLINVSEATKSRLGFRGMHGVVWEWVEDFSSVIIAGDSRDGNDTKSNQFCGAGALRAKDPAQYATFMRFAHRSSLRANHASSSLGFRCARDQIGSR